MKNKQLAEILAYAEERGIPIPADILLDLSRRESKALLDALKRPDITASELPIFTLDKPGAVPAPKKMGLILTSTGWNPMIIPSVFGGVRAHNLLGNLDYSASGHTGFQAQDITLDTLAALADGSGVLANNGAGVLSWSGTAEGTTVEDTASLDLTLTGTQITGTVLPAGVDHNSLLNYLSTRHFLQTDIINVSAALSTGILKVTTGTGALSSLAIPLLGSNGGTGVVNADGSTLTLGGATTISTGGTVALGGYTLTVPATGTAALLATANVFTANQTISSTAPSLILTDTTASAKSLTVAVDANIVNLRESAGASGSLLVLDLANARVGIGTTAPTDKFQVSVAGIVAASFVNTTVGTLQGGGMVGYSDGGAAILSGNRLGYFLLGGATGASHTFVRSAGMTASASENWSGTAAGAYLAFETTPNLSVTRSERMRIDSAGNVGIGTTAPAARLHINGTADDQQLIVEAHSTQTSNIVEIHSSASAVLASISGTGVVDAAGYKIATVAGVSGSFTTVDLKTVTVTLGIITAIV